MIGFRDDALLARASLDAGTGLCPFMAGKSKTMGK
jgi:hypothetical protein